MTTSRGLLVIHVDGLSHSRLVRAAANGLMPSVARMLNEGYVAISYRCGIPSTTPFVQAGILFGDNSEIPSYRWYDKSQKMLVKFGRGSTFPAVARHYFRGRRPLTDGGVCIAALYAAGPNDRLAPGSPVLTSEAKRPKVNGRLIRSFLTDPSEAYHWLRHGGSSFARITSHYLAAKMGRRPATRKYVLGELFHEILVHHLTRFAIREAIDEGIPAIYAGVYTYDETAHAFGPDDEVALKILRHIDHTIGLSVERAAGRYEVVVLSDHGQVPCEPFSSRHAPRLGKLIADRLPGWRVEEYDGGVFGPRTPQATGRIILTYSGGLGHLYFLDTDRRLDQGEIEKRHPGLIEWLASDRRIAFVMAKDGPKTLLTHEAGTLELGTQSSEASRTFLRRYDEPEILEAQLCRLNAFQRSGDLVIFARYDGGLQVDFEDQVGGHGSVGGEQLHPFVLARREWGWDSMQITEAPQLHRLLCQLRDQL